MCYVIIVVIFLLNNDTISLLLHVPPSQLSTAIHCMLCSYFFSARGSFEPFKAIIDNREDQFNKQELLFHCSSERLIPHPLSRDNTRLSSAFYPHGGDGQLHGKRLGNAHQRAPEILFMTRQTEAIVSFGGCVSRLELFRDLCRSFLCGKASSLNYIHS